MLNLSAISAWNTTYVKFKTRARPNPFQGIEQKMFPKIPAMLFRNFRPDGPIAVMIRKAIEMRDR